MNLDKLAIGQNPPEEINVFIEIPQKSPIKYEIDKESGLIMVDRFMHTAMSYPFNYGFIPGTQADDGDAVDVLVISTHPVQAGTVISARPIGLLEMEDEAGSDNKILAVPVEKVDPFYADVKDIKDLPEATKAMVKHFFERYKELEKGKWVKLNNFLDKKAALEDIKKGIK
jgi:inorganic pyrophosphatase